MSPYNVPLTELVLRLGSTPTRRSLLMGLLDYRVACHRIGMRDGFQWVNGSFVECASPQDGGEPSDIDVVTFFHVPTGETQESLLQADASLFDFRESKAKYKIDGYFVGLDNDLQYLVRTITYWNSLWSHTRQDVRKGYLQIALSDDNDVVARTVIRYSEEGEP
jgi:hypothetical protein